MHGSRVAGTLSDKSSSHLPKAMTDSGSSSGDWLHFYQPQAPGGRQTAHPNAPQLFGRAPVAADATVITTAAAAATSASRNVGPSNEGRAAGRPARRRSRASRRAPTTLLNTDTTNFRAMVQQFTGAPAGPFAPTVGGGGPTLNFELGGPDRRQGMAGRPYYHLQPHQYAYHIPQQQQEAAAAARGGEEGMYSVGPPGGDAFLRGGFGGPRAEADASQGFLESFAAQLAPRRAQQQPQPSTESDTGGYLM